MSGPSPQFVEAFRRQDCRTLALLPLNHLHSVKSRLAPLGVDRAALALGLLKHVAGAVVAAGISEVWVVSPDPLVEEAVRGWGIAACIVSLDGLNQGLEEARQRALTGGFGKALVVLPDLPYLRSQEIREFLDRQASENDSLWLAPDRWGRGTNMWLSQPLQGIPFLFGPESFQAHQRAAAEVGWQCQVFDSEGSRKDLDTPEDWEEFRWTLPSSCCR